MKKIFFIVGIASSIQFSNAQKSITNELPARLFIQGKEMFLNNNYTGAENTLTEFKQSSKDKSLLLETDYMIAASSYFRGKENAAIVLREYLDTYPESYHRNDICFYIGSSFFKDKEWDKALYWFKQSDVSYLSLNDQEDYTFRSAYSNLQQGNKAEAYNRFSALAKNSNRYYEPATYYKAYIDFHDGNYDEALNVFGKLKNVPEYKEQSLFFITQGQFLKGDLNGAITAGLNYLNSYPDNQNSGEVYRILGNSYYRQGQQQEAISFYEKYLSKTDKPFREDMFQLGTAYSQAGSPQDAIRALQFAASKEDKLGQASYMLLGQNYLKINDNTNALMAFDAASRVQFDPAVSEVALYNYAMLVHKTSLSVFDQSITVLQRFLQEYPNSRYVNEINKQLASTLIATKNYQAALNVIDQMRNPGQQILEAKQTILFQLGAQDFIDGKYDNAIQRFNNCISMGNYDIKSKNEAYFWRGESYYRKNEYTTATKDYQSYISQTTPSAENYTSALYNLGYSFFKEKQYPNSLNSFRQYVSQEKNRQNLTYADALNRIGDCYLYSRNFGEAERAYAQASNNNQQSAEYAEFQKAFVMGLQHNYNGKISALDAMIRKYPESQYVDDAMYEKSRALVMLNREQDATSVLSQMLNKYPDSNIAAKAGVLLGQSYYNINQTNQAIAAYKKVVDINKNTEEARIALQSLEGIYRDMNDISSYANYANSLGSGVIISTSRQDSLTYLAAENVYMKGRSAEAVNAMKKYLQSHPNGQFTGDAHYYIGIVAYEKKDNSTALSEFNQTVQSGNAKNLSKALLHIGEIQLANNDSQSAYNTFKQLERAAVNAEERNAAQLGILKTAGTSGNNNEIITVATQLLSSDKTSPEVISEARLARAKAYLATSATSKATEDLTKAATDTRSIYGSEAHYLLAETYFKAKSYDKAEQQVLSLMKQGTPHAYWLARAIIVLSDTYKAKGDKFQAKQYLESLNANYTGDESDIRTMISERLASLNK